MRCICLIGGGVAVRTHAEALSIDPGVVVSATLEPPREVAEASARLLFGALLHPARRAAR
jgi:hypothetical protein